MLALQQLQKSVSTTARAWHNLDCTRRDLTMLVKGAFLLISAFPMLYGAIHHKDPAWYTCIDIVPDESGQVYVPRGDSCNYRALTAARSMQPLGAAPGSRVRQRCASFSFFMMIMMP